ncbi:unnamed protein product [Aureobasidium vineae]|uniref:Uncharacterized protein n=1 Tax=Aureobasidium vineae TaxID=2773715 RepID=A0A9N8P5D0_9PEZI|nr:unnamed protein product [Aureobasidium vineae]
MRYGSEGSDLYIMSTVNLLGFSMLCDLHVQTDHLLLARLQHKQTVSISDLIQRLLVWIAYYGTLKGTQARLVEFISSEVPASDIRTSTLLYLRIACALRDKSLFSWLLDKTPFFSNDICLVGMSSSDKCLGLDF